VPQNTVENAKTLLRKIAFFAAENRGPYLSVNQKVNRKLI